MVSRRRIYFSEKQKAEIWDRWQRGESMSSIGRLFDRGSSSIYPLLARMGGIRPSERRRSRPTLTTAERDEISRGLGAELSLRTIARQLRRAPSTISREVWRNGGRQRYRATQSDQAAWDRARRPKPCKLADRLALCHTIAQKLERKWSPQPIAGWLKRELCTVPRRRLSAITMMWTSPRTRRRICWNRVYSSGFGLYPIPQVWCLWQPGRAFDDVKRAFARFLVQPA